MSKRKRGDGEQPVVGAERDAAAMAARKVARRGAVTTTPLGLPVEPEV